MVLFIQEGFSYYVSVQMMALLFLVGMLLQAGLALCLPSIVIAIYLLFSLLLLTTTAVAPDTISQNSPNIAFTAIGVLGYVALILSMTCLRPLRADWLLLFYRRSAGAIILAIVALVIVTDLGWVPGLTREYFALQNIDLITNYTTMDVMGADLMARERMGIQPDIDLFYGEQSFLSLVLFVSLVSHLISSRALERLRGADARLSSGQNIWGVSIPLLFSGIACMVYIKSFSSIFYAAILLGFVALNVFSRIESIRLSPAKLAVLSLLLAASIWLAIEVLPYYMHRLTTVSDSLSAQQRFGIVLDLLPQDFLLGLHSAERMPAAGFHNGAIYMVMMAGLGGIAVLAYLLERVNLKARSLGVAAPSMFAVLAVFAQNGAVFSPNKLVLISLILVPLCSAEALRRNMVAQSIVKKESQHQGA